MRSTLHKTRSQLLKLRRSLATSLQPAHFPARFTSDASRLRLPQQILISHTDVFCSSSESVLCVFVCHIAHRMSWVQFPWLQRGDTATKQPPYRPSTSRTCAERAGVNKRISKNRNERSSAARPPCHKTLRYALVNQICFLSPAPQRP